VTIPDWSAPGVFEVVPGVYRIPLPLPNDGLRAVNVYAIVGTEGPVLIDSGWAIADARELLATGLRELGAEIGDVQRFLVTHMHRDHYSQAINLRREFGTRVSLGAEERHSLEIASTPREPNRRSQVIRLRQLAAIEIADKMAAAMAAGHARPDPADWELPDDWFTNNEMIPANDRTLEVVETPGHTRGHVVFYDSPNGLLFAGDHVLPTITPSIGFEPALASDPLGAFLRSLAIVRERPDAMLLPAHGAVTDSAHARVDELVEHHRVRLDQMYNALGDGVDTAAQVAGIVTWTRRERHFDELDVFNQFLATCETGAHLDLLVLQDRVGRVERDGVSYYTAK
jgi:glyoxylase-like metal-dependent hydrolase (beta-lactamase superfamily II)